MQWLSPCLAAHVSWLSAEPCVAPAAEDEAVWPSLFCLTTVVIGLCLGKCDLCSLA